MTGPLHVVRDPLRASDLPRVIITFMITFFIIIHGRIRNKSTVVGKLLGISIRSIFIFIFILRLFFSTTTTVSTIRSW